MRNRLTLFLLLFLGIHTVTAQQITTGVIQGTVTDATGALLPGVTVEAVNVGTSLTRTLTTGEDARFVFLQLPPGTYRLTFKIPAFATLVQEDVPLTVGQTVTLPVAMKVGGVAETVTVTGGTSVVDSTRTASATTLGTLTVENIPNLGRKFEDLLTLTPGVSIVQGPDGDEITFAGQRGIFNNISLDGGDYNNGFFGEQAGGQRAAVDITLEAIKEFQVIATGAPAEFGRTAGGVVNVITKSGTNQKSGSLFHFQRIAALTGDLSDGTRLEDFRREQFGGTFGGPLKTDKAFFFVALEGITGNFKRPNLGRQVGDTPCPVANPTLQQNEALINANGDCQRTALLSFFQSAFQPERGDADRTSGRDHLAADQDRSRRQRQEQRVRIVEFQSLEEGERDVRRRDLRLVRQWHRGRSGAHQRLNLNWFTTLSSRMLNEAHFTYSREKRPRTAVESADRGRHRDGLRADVPLRQSVLSAAECRRTDLADAAQGQRLDDSRIAHLQDRRRVDAHAQRPGLPRVLHRPLHLRQRHRIPALRIPRRARRVRAEHGCVRERFVRDASDDMRGWRRPAVRCCSTCRGPALDGPATDAAGASKITNDEFSLFAQDQWQPRANLTINYGLRWDAQLMPETIDPATTAYGQFLDDPALPVRRHDPRSVDDVPAARRVSRGTSWATAGRCCAAASASTPRGRTCSRRSDRSRPTASSSRRSSPTRPTCSRSERRHRPGPACCRWQAVAPGQFPLFSGVRVFDRDYKNPRIYAYNVAYEQQLMADWAVYGDFTWTEGRNLTRFLNYNRLPGTCCSDGPGTGNTFCTPPTARGARSSAK